MASNFSGIYDVIRALIPTLTGFSEKTEIPQPYSLEDNNAHLIRDGWGLKVGDAAIVSTPADSVHNLPTYPQVQIFEVVLTRLVTTTASNTEPMVAAIKAIRDDLAIVEQGITPDLFRCSNENNVTNININSIAGIENVTTGKFNHVTASITFEITHWR